MKQPKKRCAWWTGLSIRCSRNARFVSDDQWHNPYCTTHAKILPSISMICIHKWYEGLKKDA